MLWVARNNVKWCPEEFSFTPEQWSWCAGVLVESGLVPLDVTWSSSDWGVEDSAATFFARKFREASYSCVVEVDEVGTREVHVPGTDTRLMMTPMVVALASHGVEITRGEDLDVPPLVEPCWKHVDVYSTLQKAATFMIGCGGFVAYPYGMPS